LTALGVWAVTTTAYGLFDLADGIQNVHSFRDPASGTGSSRYNATLLGVSLLSGMGFFFGTLVGAGGALLGAIQVALSRGARWCVVFALLSVGGVAGAAIVSQVRNRSDAVALDYVSWAVLGALTLPLVAVAVFVGSWVCVRAPEHPVALTPTYPGPARSS
jgi:hypothetical protein